MKYEVLRTEGPYALSIQVADIRRYIFLTYDNERTSESNRAGIIRVCNTEMKKRGIIAWIFSSLICEVESCTYIN